MSRLDVDYLLFWISLVGQVITQIAFQWQARGWIVDGDVLWSRWVITAFGAIVIPWLAIGVSTSVHPTDDEHIIFFCEVALLSIGMAVAFIMLARRRWRERKQPARHAAE